MHIRALGFTFLIVAFVFFMVGHEAPMPKSKLIEVYGVASHIKEKRGKYGGNGFEFKLTEEEGKFIYDPHGVDYKNLLNSLKKSNNKEIRILTTRESSFSSYSGAKKFPVYEIETRQHKVSYEQISNSWKQKSSWTLKISSACVIAGAFLLFIYILPRTA